jgi:hypothetical protein
MVIDTPCIRLRCWQEADREAFAAMDAHPEVMRDLGGPIGRHQPPADLEMRTQRMIVAGRHDARITQELGALALNSPTAEPESLKRRHVAIELRIAHRAKRLGPGLRHGGRGGGAA